MEFSFIHAISIFFLKCDNHMLHFSVKIIIPYKGLQLCLAIIPEEYNIIFIVIVEMTMGNSAAVVCCKMAWDGSEAVRLLFCGSFLHAYPVKMTRHMTKWPDISEDKSTGCKCVKLKKRKKEKKIYPFMYYWVTWERKQGKGLGPDECKRKLGVCKHGRNGGCSQSPFTSS